MKTALITGITGQDGSWLAELLLAKGYAVHGTVRRTSTPGDSRLLPFLDRLVLHPADMTDAGSLRDAVAACRPDEVYNLAAQSHVGTSWAMPAYTTDVAGLGAVRLLDAVRAEAPSARVYQASTCEIFGASPAPQCEATPLAPRNPYAVGKAAAYHAVRNHRDAYGMFAVNGILFNHESERRGERFVTRKITRAVGRIVAGTQGSLALGNLDARRDWGHAEDYVEAMWRMLQLDAPEDLVVATGVSHSVQDFVEAAFTAAGLDWREHVTTDPALVRPIDIPELVGDASRARERIGWSPRVGFDALVRRMVDHDVRLARVERDCGEAPVPRR
ncbi:MAG: GDP-mannose 4,6-dehydratase [Myxococcales bacterium]|nr:GDP-mannose 4,6-dehydratase [Myxococcales bacterium]